MKIKDKRPYKSLEDYTEPFDLKRSLDRFGAIYPIVKSQFGLVDGRHREALGVKETKEVKLGSLVDHWILRYHLLHHAKTEDELQKDKAECINELYKTLEKERPQATKRELVRETANLLGLTERTIWKYVGYVAEAPSATLSPSEKARQTRQQKEEKMRQERSRTLSSLYNVLDRLTDKDGKPLTTFEKMREIAWIKELLRDSKPIFRDKETLDLWYERIVKDNLKPSDAFAHIYLDHGINGQGWTVRLPLWFKYFLERNGSSAEHQLRRLVEERARQEGLSKESFVDRAKDNLISRLALWKALSDVDEYEKESKGTQGGS